MIGLRIKKLFEVGAVACYLLAENFGEPAFDFLQKRLKHWRYTIELQKQNIFLYLLFLRCTNGFTVFDNLGFVQITDYNDEQTSSKPSKVHFYQTGLLTWLVLYLKYQSDITFGRLLLVLLQ